MLAAPTAVCLSGAAAAAGADAVHTTTTRNYASTLKFYELLQPGEECVCSSKKQLESRATPSLPGGGGGGGGAVPLELNGIFGIGNSLQIKVPFFIEASADLHFPNQFQKQPESMLQFSQLLPASCLCSDLPGLLRVEK